MPQTTEDKFKILIAGLSQFSNNENDILPTPDYNRLAKDLGLPNYASAQGVWRRLRNELKRGGLGGLKIRDVAARPKSPVQKRAADEPIVIEDDSESSPIKRVAKCGPRKGIGKAGKEKVDKESNGEIAESEFGSMDDQDWYLHDEA
ncbi:hypothetical protein OCU04_002403 [Sclerotinia nivalis]|uniref:Uncharacterized protein n=1 Tax=Sclerotinia nivalis TaxID=352851 RepID=A0A9X0DMJ4_9HELO|nr:hypothetical protein OCU04_002403 [Sclerotinia nivalis]